MNVQNYSYQFYPCNLPKYEFYNCVCPLEENAYVDVVSLTPEPQRNFVYEQQQLDENEAQFAQQVGAAVSIATTAAAAAPLDSQHEDTKNLADMVLPTAALTSADTFYALHPQQRRQRRYAECEQDGATNLTPLPHNWKRYQLFPPKTDEQQQVDPRLPVFFQKICATWQEPAKRYYSCSDVSRRCVSDLGSERSLRAAESGLPSELLVQHYDQDSDTDNDQEQECTEYSCGSVEMPFFLHRTSTPVSFECALDESIDADAAAAAANELRNSYDCLSQDFRNSVNQSLSCIPNGIVAEMKQRLAAAAAAWKQKLDNINGMVAIELAQ